MRKVERSEIVDFQTYNDGRESNRPQVLEIKRRRRVHIGEHLTMLFENHDTIRYQIQEIMRTERIVREADIQQEIATYNGMLGDDGELGGCLLVEIDDRALREARLAEWLGLPDHLYLRCADGTRVRPSYDRAQIEEERISSVQYLKFAVGDGVPAAIGCDLPALTAETVLTDEQREALLADLAGR